MRFTINTVLMKQFDFLRTHAADCCFLTVPVPLRHALHLLAFTALSPDAVPPLLSPKGFSGQEVAPWVGAKLETISHLEEILGTQTLSLRNHECFCCQKRLRGVWWLTFHDLNHQGLHAIHSLGEYLWGTFYMTVTVSGFVHAKMNKYHLSFMNWWSHWGCHMHLNSLQCLMTNALPYNTYFMYNTYYMYIIYII